MTARTGSFSLLASFQASYADLVRYLARRTGSAESARDAAHDTWLRVADMAARGQGPALACEDEARAYLFAMARNLVIDQQRRQGLELRHAATPAHGGAHTPDVAEAAMYGQAIAAVEAALAGLPDRVRQVFLRSRVHGEDQGALAAEFGVSRNMIERDMIRAMDGVQRALEQWRAGHRPPDLATEGAAPAPRAGRRRSLAALLGVAGLAMGGVGGVAGWRWWRLAVPEWQQTASTAHGRTLRQPLPDGSVLSLDAATRVAVAYYAALRRVQLQEGAAFFEVAPDAGRPFVVEVAGDPATAHAGVRITVLGTRFGVERGAHGAVQVQVESGRVRVETLDAAGLPVLSRELAAGDALRIDAEHGFAQTRLPDPRAAAGWRHGAVGFDAVPLGEAVGRLRRYLPRPVEVDAAAAGLRLSGQVRIAQAEDFVRALPGVLPVRSRLQNGRWRVDAIAQGAPGG